MLEKTPFVQAVDKRDFEQALQLLDQGQRIPAGTTTHDLPFFLHQIVRDNGHKLLHALSLAGAIPNDIYDYDRFIDSIYHAIFKVNEPNEELLALLRSLLDDAQNLQDEVDGHTLLSYALENQAAPSIIKTLIDAGLDSSFRNNADATLLHNVVSYSHAPIDRQLAYIDLLLAAGLDVNDTNVVKQTALHMAVERNKPQLIDVLLQHGASPNQQDAEGNSPYFYAIAHKFDIGMYTKFAAYETIDFEQRNKHGVSALHEYLRMLTASYETNPTLLVQLLQDGADLDSTSLHYQMPKSGWSWVVQKDPVLLEEALKITAVDVDKQDDDGNTLLHLVCAIDCNHDQKTAKNIYRKVKQLLDAGASVDLTNNKEQTPLSLAATDNLKTKTVELLLAQQKS